MEFPCCPMNCEMEVSVPWHVSWGIKIHNSKKFGKKVLNIY